MVTAFQSKKRSFGAGEIAEEYHDHDDYRVHQTGLAKCRNFVVRPGGGLTRRPPTEFVRMAQPGSRLIGIQFSSDDAFMLEMWDGNCRFYRNGSLLLDGGVPYQITHPFLASELPRLRWQRSGDVVYFTHRTRGMWQFVRRGNVDWLSEPFVFKVRPFDDENFDKAKMISASAATGTVTLTAHGFTFDAAMVGEHFKLRDGDQRVLKAWRADTAIGFNDVVMYNERVYRNINTSGANTGQYQPVHVEGVRGADYGSGGALWEFVRRDFGVVEIVTVASGGATATANVLVEIPEEFNSVHNAAYGGTARSYRWSEQLYSSRKGWPRYMNIYKQRLYLYDRFGFYYSVQSSYDDFTVGATPDLAGYELLGASTEMTADIKWATSGKVNIIGAGGEEFAVAASSSVQNGVSVSDLKIDHATSDGSTECEPVRAKASVLHTGPDGRSLYEMAYNFQIDDFDSDEASLPSSHLLEPGVARMAWQRNPLSVIWMRLQDGGLLGYTYNPKQELKAFHLHPMDGCEVTDIAVTGGDPRYGLDIYFRMRRTIGTRVVETIERFLPFFVRSRDTDPTLQPYLDCQSTAVGTNIASVSGLAHLAGATVRVVSNLGDHGAAVVDVNGAIDVDGEGVTRVVVGLPYRSHGRLLPLAPDGETGGTTGKTVQVKEVKFRGLGVSDCFVGNIDDDLGLAEAIFPPQPAIDAPIVLQTGKDGTPLTTGWDEQGVMDFWTDGPFAFEVTGIDRVTTRGSH